MILKLLKVLPKNLLSRFTGWVVHLERPEFLATMLKTWFVGRYRIRMDEAEKSLVEYPSTGALFVRKLKSGLRPLESDLVHPCDSVIAVSGTAKEGQLIQAKGWTYSLGELFGDLELGKTLQDGKFLTYYLCPTDYHRVHSPCDGQLLSVRHLTGTLWPVNPDSVSSVQNLFVKNERVVFEIETVFGVMVLVMVGATNVGRISVTKGPKWETNLAGPQVNQYKRLETPVEIKAGEELGVFHMGSTVICVWPKQTPVGEFTDQTKVRLGGSIR